jgi:LytS/YehU family sensor histidine kinase
MKDSNHQEIKANTKECQDIISLKLKDFHSQMNPHFIFNSLNAIQYFITCNNKELSLKYLSLFGKLIRFNLKQLDKELVSINDEILMLEWYLSLQKLRYHNSFSYQINIDKRLIISENKIPSHILQSLVENLIEHAVFNEHTNHSIDIDFISNNEKLKVITSYSYQPKRDSKHNITPIYRKQITKWQDQIRLYNKMKEESITKKITFQKNGILQGGNIFLELPIIN